MTTIDAFPHVMPRACYDKFVNASSGAAYNFLTSLTKRAPLAALWDLDARFQMMDGMGDYVQVLTLCTPPIEVVAQGQLGIDLARMVNDAMAELVAKFPERFKGFAASLPLDDVDAALTEVERTVGQLGALGIQIFTNVNGLPPDEPRFQPLFARMAALDKPIWVHGWRSPFLPDYAGETESRYGMWLGLGWPYEMSLLMARLVLSGTMERYPNLRILTHHGGGMTPMFHRRMGTTGAMHEQSAYFQSDSGALERLPKSHVDYLKMFYADTTGQSPIAITAALEFFGPQRVLMGSDYPWTPPPALMEVLDGLGLPSAIREQVLTANAQRVLGVRL